MGIFLWHYEEWFVFQTTENSRYWHSLTCRPEWCGAVPRGTNIWYRNRSRQWIWLCCGSNQVCSSAWKYLSRVLGGIEVWCILQQRAGAHRCYEYFQLTFCRSNNIHPRGDPVGILSPVRDNSSDGRIVFRLRKTGMKFYIYGTCECDQLQLGEGTPFIGVALKAEEKI